MSSGKSALLMGYGLMGRAALYDMLKFGDFEEIRVIDKNPALESQLVRQDAGDTRLVPLNVDIDDREALKSAMKGVDIAICLLPKTYTLLTAELAVEMGVNYSGASYLVRFTLDEKDRAEQEKRLEDLDREARKKGLTVLPQFGLDPGLDLLLAGEAVRRFDEVEDFCSYGAGFPELEAADNALKYKFCWTPEGVMRSYYRAGRTIRDGKVVEVPAERQFGEENIHTLVVDELGGTLECFLNGDTIPFAEALGVRDTVKNFGRYVCRWEGHCDFWRVIANSGFMRDEPVAVGNAKVDGVSFLTSLLTSQPEFFYKENERDVTLTRVDVRGRVGNEKKREVFQIIDKRDLETGFSSMARTVGFTLSMGTQMVLDGDVPGHGIVNPIDLPYDLTVGKLAERGIHVNHWVE